MKNQLIAICMMVGLFMGVALMGHAQNSNDNGLVGRAIGAFRSQCTQNYNGQIRGFVETVGICFVSGEIKRVHLYPVVNCPNNGPCPYAVVLLGSVDFGCDGEIIAVNCANQ